jgi:glycerol-3-phosphate acyltransferase PlsX
MLNKDRIRIAIDAMGGDHAPSSIVEGAVLAQRNVGDKVELILLGDSGLISSELNKLNAGNLPIRVNHCDQTIGMAEEAVESIRRKPDSSIVAGLDLQKNREAEAFISAGNTGAVMAASLITLGRLRGVHRPAIVSLFPTEKGTSILLDVGANSDCKAVNLYQFALMGVSYFSLIFNKENPSVGLLSIGEEKSKGNEVTIESHKLISNCELNFVGNLEGRDILKGKADVIVCDGFVGNIILKFAESIESYFSELFKKRIRQSLFVKIGALLMNRAFKDLKRNLDYAEYGGAPLLGISGVSVICHGGSSPKAIKNAVYAAKSIVENNLNDKIENRIAANGNLKISEVKLRQS